MSKETDPTKGKRTRSMIMDSAYTLFLEQGFHGTSMRQVAQRAGLAVSGIYNHFPSKEALFGAILLDKHPYKQILPLLINVPGQSIEEYVQNSARALIDELGSHPDLIKLMFIEIVEFNGKNLPKFFETIQPTIVPLLERFGCSKDRLRQIAPTVLLRAFMGLFFSYYIVEQSLEGNHQSALGEIAFNDLVDIYLHGILIKE